VAVVAEHQTVRQMSQGVRVAGPECAHHLSSGQVLRHGVLYRSVTERRRAVVSVQNGDSDLPKRKAPQLPTCVTIDSRTERFFQRSWRWFSHSRNSQSLMEPGCSLPYRQQQATGPRPQPQVFNQHPRIILP
jgi:hypothetical protein